MIASDNYSFPAFADSSASSYADLREPIDEKPIVEKHLVYDELVWLEDASHQLCFARSSHGLQK